MLSVRITGVIVYLARKCMFLLCLAYYGTCLPEHSISNAPSQDCWKDNGMFTEKFAMSTQRELKVAK